MKRGEHQIIATWIFGSIFVVFLMGVFIFAPNELPPYKHKLLALFSALMAGLFTFFLSGSLNLLGEPTLGQIGKIGIKAAGGVAVFLIVLWFWNSELSPVKVQKNAIIPVVSNGDIHLGDNIFPVRWGYNHNPLNIRVYPQKSTGLIYFDKKEESYVAGAEKQTVVAQNFVHYYEKLITGLDLSGYEFVSAHEGEDGKPPELEKYLKENDSAHFIKLGPTYLYTNSDNKGNFYEMFAAVAFVSAVDFTIPLAKSNIDIGSDNIEKIEFYIECYHGGLRKGQANNFSMMFNDTVFDLYTKSTNMREKEVVVVEIPVDIIKTKQENVVSIFVLPWQEFQPKSFATNNGPVHFRDIGIVNAYFRVKAI